jgi:hypothetical protein
VGGQRRLLRRIQPETPPAKISIPPKPDAAAARGRPGRHVSPACLPMAWTSRPTLGSLPATAHLKRGALTIAFPSARAAGNPAPLRTDTRITWRTPSPLRTTSSARSAHTTALQRGLEFPGSGQGTRPDETRATVSDVLVSLSMLMELKVGLHRLGKHRAQLGPPWDRHVGQEIDQHGGQLGSIMPGALCDPDDRAAADRPRRTLG